MKRGLLLFVIVFAVTVYGYSQSTIKFMTYNLLNFNESASIRTGYFKTIVDDVNPDLLVVQEMVSQNSVNLFYNQVLNPEWLAGTFIDGPDSDNAVFYKKDLFTFVQNTAIPTGLRDISQFTLVFKPTGDTLLVYSVHLKASSGSSNEAQRAAEVNILRGVTNGMPPGTNFLVCGDFNIYKSSEQAYLNLITDNGVSDGHFIDPLPISGTWNNSIFAPYHTQSPRIRQFGGGATGGLDDRFDMILYSQAIADAGKMVYVANSTWAVGNDGNHYNDSVNRMPNNSVTQIVANALHNASDHLPVVAQFRFDPEPVTEIIEIPLKSGWNGLSAWLEPVDPDVTDVTASLGNKLILIENFDQVYWPGQGINTLSQWNFSSGYFIKLTENTNLTFLARQPSSREIGIFDGWNILPVLTAEPVQVSTLFAENLIHIEIIKDAAGTNVYWPDQEVMTLQYLQPGKAYLLKSNLDFTISF